MYSEIRAEKMPIADNKGTYESNPPPLRYNPHLENNLQAFEATTPIHALGRNYCS